MIELINQKKVLCEHNKRNVNLNIFLGNLEIQIKFIKEKFEMAQKEAPKATGKPIVDLQYLKMKQKPKLKKKLRKKSH